MTLRPKFPLPKGYFGRIHVSPQEEDFYRSAVQESVSKALKDEHTFNCKYHRQVDLQEWRQVKQKHGLSIYRRRRSALKRMGERQASMLGVGCVEGALKDILYGWYDKTHEEIHTSIAMLSESAVDVTVLHTIESATPEDPFHYIGLKWMLAKVPVLRPRDWCYVDAMGIEQDEYGRRYGYLVQKSVDVANCPPFHSNGIIRAKATFTFILRERLEDGVVDVFSYGYFDTPGEVLEQISIFATIDILCGVFQSVRCGEAKKLTVLAVQKAGTRLRQLSLADKTFCFMCHKKSGVFSSMRTCKICLLPICTSCQVKKWTFVGRDCGVRKVSCCLSCIREIKSMKVCPAEPEFSITPSQSLYRYKQANAHGLRDRFDTADTQYSECDEELDQSYWNSSRSGVVIDFIEDDEIKQILEESRLCMPTLQEEEPKVRSSDYTQQRSNTFFEQLQHLHKQSKKVSAMTRANNKIMKKVC